MHIILSNVAYDTHIPQKSASSSLSSSPPPYPNKPLFHIRYVACFDFLWIDFTWYFSNFLLNIDCISCIKNDIPHNSHVEWLDTEMVLPINYFLLRWDKNQLLFAVATVCPQSTIHDSKREKNIYKTNDIESFLFVISHWFVHPNVNGLINDFNVIMTTHIYIIDDSPALE